MSHLDRTVTRVEKLLWCVGWVCTFKHNPLIQYKHTVLYILLLLQKDRFKVVYKCFMHYNVYTKLGDHFKDHF